MQGCNDSLQQGCTCSLDKSNSWQHGLIVVSCNHSNKQKPNLKETEMETFKTPDFTRLIAELRTRVCINDVDAEAIEQLLQDDYYIAISSARNEAYYEGHSDGYARGYDDGSAE